MVISNGVVLEILAKYCSAREKFSRFNSAHEGFAVIKEELDELWDEIKKKNQDGAAMRKEAIQVGAMALAFVVDLSLIKT